MNQSRYFYYLLFICCALFSTPLVTAFDAFDDLVSFADSDAGAELINNTTFNVVRAPSKQAIIAILDELDFFPLLQENIFLRTNILRSRSLLDYPDFIPWRHDRDKRAIYIDLFYNQTSRMFFNKDSGNICTYLAVTSPSFIATIDKILDNARKAGFIQAADQDKYLQLINLFQTFTVQERRFGLMIGGKTTINRWQLHIMAPWYYLERNHFVDEKVQEDLQALTADIFGAPQTPEEIARAEKLQHEFEDNYLIADKFGIGDTRVYCDYPIIKKKYLSTRLGFLATIPTAFAMKKGLKGSSFERVQFPELLNLQELVDAALIAQQNGTPIADVQAFDYALDVLSNLSAMLLEAPMGNGGHLGLGGYIRNRSPLSSFIKQDWARLIYMRSFISLEYLFPATEWRSFRVPVNETLFNERDLTNIEDQAIINSNYEFILQQLNDRLFPRVFQTKVYPGFIFRWSSQFCYETDTAGFTFGTDTYVRNKESLNPRCAPAIARHIIDITHAECPLSYQSKICAQAFYKITKPDQLWTVGLIGDYTFMNKGIGADYMLALKAHVMF